MNLNTKIVDFYVKWFHMIKGRFKLGVFLTLKMTRKTHMNLERFLVSV
jgi:hypothetical protein